MAQIEPAVGEKSSAYDVRSTALRGLLVGLAVGVALVITWYPATTCKGEGFSCLGNVVLTIFATPVVAFVVALVVAAMLHIRKPWLLALLGPFAAFGIIRTTFEVLDPGWTALIVSAVIATIGYVVLALLVGPGASWAWRLATAVVVAALIFGPGLLDGS